jgi:hypothetical protein
MSEFAPPTQIRSGPPPGPARTVRRGARLRDHESDGQARTVVGRDRHEHEGQDFDEPAVVVSHPAAAVCVGEAVTGHVVELTPRRQPVLQADHLRLLLDAPLPFMLNTEIALTVTQVEPRPAARIDAVNGERIEETAIVPLMVLALSDREVAAAAPAPTGYAGNRAMMRARMRQETDEGEW